MHIRFMTLAVAGVITLAACSQSAPVETTAVAGAVQQVEEPGPLDSLYSPEDRTALAFGLPNQVSGRALLPSSLEIIVDDESRFASGSRVRPILVDLGYSPDRVSIAQKGSYDAVAPTVSLSAIPAVITAADPDPIPVVGLAAVQTRGVPAARFTRWDPTFYLLLTSVDAKGYRWLGEKPGRERAVIAGRAVWFADFERFKVAWYPKGDTLYVALARNDQLLEASISAMPEPEPIAET